MNPEHNHERRLARAKALVDLHANDTGAVYVDAAEHQDQPGTFVAAVVAAATGKTKSAASFRASRAHQAEEVAIALAIADPKCTTVLSDSRTAVMNYARNNVCSVAARVLRGACDGAVSIKWFPAHMGPSVSCKGNANHNETANAVARGLANRAAAVSAEPSEWQLFNISKDPMTAYNDVVKWYRLSRRTMPPPHPGLTRSEAVLYRQLQTGSLLTPVLAKHICPEVYESDVCRLCAKERATAAHILWNCELYPYEASAMKTIPLQFEAAARSGDYDTQLQAVQQVAAALDRQRPGNSAGEGASLPQPADSTRMQS